MTKVKFFCLFLLCFSQMEAQKILKQDTISTKLTRYFTLDRENIHLHLNKKTYIANEKIWFKGYGIEKKNLSPYQRTANVYVSLLDATGKIINTNLYYSENSTIEGAFKLDKTLKTGVYFLRVYTNYMNNFTEDESSVYEIEILNPNETGYPASRNINYDEITINFHPESGTFLEGAANVIGVTITDCNGNGVSVNDATVVDPTGTIVTNFSTNMLGIGKFDIPFTTSQLYKAAFEVKGRKFEKTLPQPTIEGITFSVNNYTIPDKTVVKLKTNNHTQKKKEAAAYQLVIQQNATTTSVDFSFSAGKNEETLTIPNEYFSEGINTIFLLDKDHKSIGERIVYVPSLANLKSELRISQRRGDSIVITGVSPLKLASLSVSVLAADAEMPESTIFGSFQFDNSLAQRIRNISYYMTDFSRKKQYELDNFLLSAKPKYSWSNLMAAPPKQKFDFDDGLIIKGTVNNVVTDKQNSTISMNAIMQGLSDQTKLNEKNEFYFKNVMAVDSSVIFFSLLNKKSQFSEVKLYPQILNNNRLFLKPFPERKICTALQQNVPFDNFELPKIKDVINIESVKVAAKEKEKLDKENKLRHNNGMAKGFKVTDELRVSHRDLLDFIRANGFNVLTNGSQVTITAQSVRSFGGSNRPAIYLDDIPTPADRLLSYSMEMIDEIYISKRSYGGGLDGPSGIIRIYSRRDFGAGEANIKPKSQSLLVRNGYQPLIPFKNPEYESYWDGSFLRLGTIHWDPEIPTDANGNFRVAIPNLNQKKVKIRIEGISGDGQIISETKTLELFQ